MVWLTLGLFLVNESRFGEMGREGRWSGLPGAWMLESELWGVSFTRRCVIPAHFCVKLMPNFGLFCSEMWNLWEKPYWHL